MQKQSIFYSNSKTSNNREGRNGYILGIHFGYYTDTNLNMYDHDYFSKIFVSKCIHSMSENIKSIAWSKICQHAKTQYKDI